MGTSGLIQSPVCFNHSASFTDSIEVSWKIVRLNMGLVSGVVRIMSEYDQIQNRNRRVFRPLTSHIDFYSTLLSPDFWFEEKFDRISKKLYMYCLCCLLNKGKSLVLLWANFLSISCHVRVSNCQKMKLAARKESADTCKDIPRRYSWYHWKNCVVPPQGEISWKNLAILLIRCMYCTSWFSSVLVCWYDRKYDSKEKYSSVLQEHVYSSKWIT